MPPAQARSRRARNGQQRQRGRPHWRMHSSSSESSSIVISIQQSVRRTRRRRRLPAAFQLVRHAMRLRAPLDRGLCVWQRQETFGSSPNFLLSRMCRVLAQVCSHASSNLSGVVLGHPCIVFDRVLACWRISACTRTQALPQTPSRSVSVTPRTNRLTIALAFAHRARPHI